MQKALFRAVESEEKKVSCGLCPHDCSIKAGKTGFCRVRKNVDGELYSLIYGRHASVGLDPIEKKPLYHFFPGKDILSFGTLGCNLTCQFCQNWEISQADINTDNLREILPADAVRLVNTYDSVGIAYTYNEPLINYEWVLDTAKKAGDKGFKNVLVTNGFINELPLHKLLPYIDAANVDVKAFKNDFYKRNCSGMLGPVMRSVEIMFKAGIHLEITMLLIPGENDSPDEISDLVDWISSMDVHIPLHFSRYFPNYKFSKQQTPHESLVKAREIALKRLKYVFLGNVPYGQGSDTFCPECGGLIIGRKGFSADTKNIKEGVCGKCGIPLSALKIIS